MCKHTSPPWRWEPKLWGNVRVCIQRDNRQLKLRATCTHGLCVATQLLNTNVSLSPHLRPSSFNVSLVASAVQPQLCSEAKHLGEPPGAGLQPSSASSPEPPRSRDCCHSHLCKAVVCQRPPPTQKRQHLPPLGAC